tara:strand:- start:1895 stop:3037 length:1143 start_codon:yes stop_codon:yes gene_type:complete
MKILDIERLKIDDSLDATKEHIDKAINWILINQNRQPDGGVPATISFYFGRIISSGSFPEVTGYIIKTLFDYAKVFDSLSAFESAIKASEFELQFQNENGSFPGGGVGSLKGPSVFNTGQIVHGLIRAYIETNDDKYLQSCIRACDWIIEVQRPDGAWNNYNYRNLARTYDSKVSEPLLEVAKITNNIIYVNSATSNLDYILTNQKFNGWFYNCDNTVENNNAPLLHLIGYTIDGLLNCYRLTGEDKYLKAAKIPLEKLMHKFEISKKPLPERLFSNWTSNSNCYCVTGLAQISLCWAVLYTINEDYRLLNAALKMNDVLKTMQFNFGGPKILGSLPSSYPFWGDYNSYAINSWGVKYYIDSLIQEYQIKMKLNEIDSLI